MCRPYGPHPPRTTARVAPTVRTNRSYNRDRSPHPSRCACHLPQRKARAGLGPTPTANPETVRFYRRGRTPAGPQIHAARPGGRALQPSTSRRLLGRPKCRCGTAPAAVFTDSGPQRPGGRGSGRLIAAPTADNGPFLENGGRGKPLPYSFQENFPGLGRGGSWASRRQQTKYRWLDKPRRSCEIAAVAIFHQTRPQWAERNRGMPLKFCAPEILQNLTSTRPL